MRRPPEHRIRRMTAEHEAAHTVAAQRMGLPVAWVTIDPGQDEGIGFDAAVKVPDELIDRERDMLAICVATAAPSFLRTHIQYEIGRYARIEASLAYELGGMAGISFEEISRTAAEIVSDHEDEIKELSRRLLAEGRVVFEEVCA